MPASALQDSTKKPDLAGGGKESEALEGVQQQQADPPLELCHRRIKTLREVVADGQVLQAGAEFVCKRRHGGQELPGDQLGFGLRHPACRVCTRDAHGNDISL